jgi:hypothetical protein
VAADGALDLEVGPPHRRIGELVAAEADAPGQQAAPHRHAEVGPVEELVGEVAEQAARQGGDRGRDLAGPQVQGGDEGSIHRENDRPLSRQPAQQTHDGGAGRLRRPPPDE